jgi:hypothetical protein
MQEQQNIDLVKKLYAAFGKGDIETIIDHLADWIPQVAGPDDKLSSRHALIGVSRG